MLMLVSSPTRPERSQGFTLLEILMVLMLVGLAGSVVVPRVGGIYDNLVLRSDREELLRDIQGLPARAYAEGRVYAARPQATTSNAIMLASALEVPSGWSLEFSEQLIYRANGFCGGGEMTISHEQDRRWRYILAAPFCVPVEVEDAG